MREVGIHLGSPHPNSSCWDTTRLAWLPGQSKGGRMMTTNKRHRRRVLRHVQSAVAATDDGHQASGVDASWAVGHPEKLVDFGYRALKETTDVAKAIIVALKSNGARRSYFMGCSDGGREALMEAQRFPRDFDGIVAGSPANYWTHLFTGFVWDQKALAATSSGDLSQADLNVASNAMLAQCAGHDGGLSTDQFLNNPPACRFNPEKLSLPKDKIEAVKKIFSGPPGIFPGYRVTGDEVSNQANWPG